MSNHKCAIKECKCFGEKLVLIKRGSEETYICKGSEYYRAYMGVGWKEVSE